jgi:hypothetical protein
MKGKRSKNKNGVDQLLFCDCFVKKGFETGLWRMLECSFEFKAITAVFVGVEVSFVMFVVSLACLW